MSFLPIFPDWEATELVGTGGYGRVFKCVRKKTSSKNTTQTQKEKEESSTDTKSNVVIVNENTLSSKWNPHTVALKTVSYVRDISSSSSNLAAKLSNNQLQQHQDLPWCGDISGLEGLKEAAALQTTGPHPNLIRLHSCFYSMKYKSLCIVQEWADGPTLGDIYMNLGALSEKAMTSITLDLLHGMLQLHSSRLIHRDVKPTNILTTKNGIAKIADFGVSALRPEFGDYRKTYVGTAGFMAPEVSARGGYNNPTNDNVANVNASGASGSSAAAAALGRFGPMSARAAICGPGEGYNEAADVWSLGVTLLEGAIGQIPAHEYVAKVARCFFIEAEAECRRNSQLGKKDPFPNFDEQYGSHRKQLELRMRSVFNLSNNFSDLLLSMLDPLPSRRPSCLELLTQHPFCIKALEQMMVSMPEQRLSSSQQAASPLVVVSSGGHITDSNKQISAFSSPLVNNSSIESNKEQQQQQSASSSPATTGNNLLASPSNIEDEQHAAAAADAENAAAATLAYLKDFYTNKQFRYDFIKAINRIPRSSSSSNRNRNQANFLNPSNVLAGDDNNEDNESSDLIQLLSNAKKNNIFHNLEDVKFSGSGIPRISCDGGVGGDSGGVSGFCDTFRVPKAGNWILPPSKFIDVICALDFPVSSSTIKYSIPCASSSSSQQQQQQQQQNAPNQNTNEMNFLPVSTTIQDSSVLLCGEHRSTEGEFLKGARRLENSNTTNTNIITNINISNSSLTSSPTLSATTTSTQQQQHLGVTSGSNSASKGNTPRNQQQQTPRIQQAAQGLLPFNSVFQQIVLPSLDSASLRSARIDSWIADDIITQQQQNQKSSSSPDNTNASSNFLYQRQQQQQKQSQESGGSSGGYFLSYEKEDDDDDESHLLQQTTQLPGVHEQLASFDNLRRVISECEATVPNFSESFFQSISDISVCDPSACALVTHAFDRGQWVTRHRDGLSHGMNFSKISSQQQQQNPSSGSSSSRQQQQQQQPPTSSGAQTGTIPLTGRRSTKVTPRIPNNPAATSTSGSTMDQTSSTSNTNPGAPDTSRQQHQQQQNFYQQQSQQNTQQFQNLYAPSPLAPPVPGSASAQAQLQGSAQNVFNPLPASSAYLHHTIPTRASEGLSFQMGTNSIFQNSSSQQNQQQQQQTNFSNISHLPPTHESWHLAIPQTMLNSLKDVTSIMNSNDNNNLSALDKKDLDNNNNSDSVDYFSLTFRDRWLSLGVEKQREHILKFQQEEQRISEERKQQKILDEEKTQQEQEQEQNNNSSAVDEKIGNDSNITDDGSNENETEENKSGKNIDDNEKDSKKSKKQNKSLDLERHKKQQQELLEIQQHHSQLLNSSPNPTNNNNSYHDFLVSDGISQDGNTVYAPDILFGHEAMKFHSNLVSNLKGRVDFT